MKKIGLNMQFNNFDKYFLKIYDVENLKDNSPIDIAKARIFAEEREINLFLTKKQIAISDKKYFDYRIKRRVEEKKTFLAGGESPLNPSPSINIEPTRRRQTKDLWCFNTTALMLAEDTGFIKSTYKQAIESYKPILYNTNPKIRHKYCGYNLDKKKYYCDPGQEYTVLIYGDPPKSCLPGDIQRAVTLLTGKKMIKFGNNFNHFWLNSDGKLDLNKQRFLASNLKTPAVCDGFINGDPYTEKGHSFLINKFKYEDKIVKLFTEECVYGEKPIIKNFSNYIDCSVFEFRMKITNIYCFK